MSAKSVFSFLILVCLVVLQCQAPSGELIFRSGFEPDSRMANHTSGGIDVVGIDRSVKPPNNWETLIENPRIGKFNIQFQGGDTTRRKAQIIEDPTQPGNHVLQYWMKYPNVNYEKSYGGKARIQTNFYENEGLFDIYYKVRLYLTEDWNILKSNEDAMKWYIMAEYWNNAGWLDEGHQYRMHLLIKKEAGAGSPLFFEVGGQPLRGDRKHLWQYENHEFSIPVGEWLDLEIYLKEGNQKTGRYYLAVTRSNGVKSVIFDFHNFTHHPDDPEPDGFRHLNLLKAYSHRDNVNYVRENGGVLQVLWDDWEVWTGRMPGK